MMSRRKRNRTGAGRGTNTRIPSAEQLNRDVVGAACTSCSPPPVLSLLRGVSPDSPMVTQDLPVQAAIANVLGLPVDVPVAVVQREETDGGRARPDRQQQRGHRYCAILAIPRVGSRPVCCSSGSRASPAALPAARGSLPTASASVTALRDLFVELGSTADGAASLVAALGTTASPDAVVAP